ncbi:DUF6376 family protein [Salinibacillus xinjiangensis]|uniref:Lipoprotein n=1 Tax=Salinibacillus xinjiangensis TaxID=1229268 RepID=A0A6G1X752_9BACI|nr:DUF6376 family protein [Salinibacillus xinjiangensis]MRG86833.1 hypothetical protein [Salinibacillus xinjiangensis]
MKKIAGLFILLTILLTGCSLFNEVNESLDYVNETKDYIQTLSDFGAEAPQLIEEANSNPEVEQELQQQLEGLQGEVDQFLQMEPPAVAEDLHQQLVNHSENLETTINQVMENGNIAIEQLENSQLIRTINEINNLLNQLENLQL